MIIAITEHCTMDCTHCCMNASTDGKHMSKEIFLKALDFYQQFNFPFINISGGEPTDHPLFEEFMDEILKRKLILTILSNGLWTLDERRDKYLAKYRFQIINDQRYYPIKVPEIKHPNIVVFGKVENSINRCTRSIKNNNFTETKPKCFNIRSISKNNRIRTFKDLIYTYTFELLKFCVPIIKIDGSMILGECDLCKVFGHIDDCDKVLLDKVKDFKCNNCGCFNNLDSFYRNHLGE